METPQNSQKQGFWQKYRGLPKNVLALSFVSFLNDTSGEIVYPLLPVFLFLTLGASPFYIGLIEGFAESFASILKLFAGYLSDKFGNRKLPVFLGYSLAAVARPLLAFVTTWQQVLFVRLSDRVGKGIRGAPRDALIAAGVPPHRRGFAFGFNRAADHLGAVVGPVIAFVILTYLAADPTQPTSDEYRQLFLFASIPVVIGLFVIGFFVREEARPANFENEMPVKISLREFDSDLKRFLGVIVLFTISNSTDAFLLLRAEQAGIAPAMLPILWMVLHFSKVFSSLIAGELSDRIGRKGLIIGGWIVYAFVYAGFAFVSGPWQAWVLFVIYGLYFGMTEGNEKAFVADMVAPEKRGTAYGLYNLAFGISVFPASLLFGFLWTKFGPETAFLTSGAISMIAAVLFIVFIDGRKNFKDEAQKPV
jgi:MFS family permease